MPFLSALIVSVTAVQEPKPPEKKAPPDHPARALFVAQCAQCHGESGDGVGTTKLDRPARSFLDGGFSYGNTPEALLRSITFGIPGTPMPSFAQSTSEAERKGLAEYVLLLGPPQERQDPKASVMVVKDKPLVVRGKLPPIVEGAPETVRGLLIGTPEGLTFEYRVDDVRLLGVRQGEFVDRADWRGRGGSGLQPLGKVLWTDEQGQPPPHFTCLAEIAPGNRSFEARFRGTWAREGRVGVSYDLLAAGVVCAHVEESPEAYVCKLGTGWRRSFKIMPVADMTCLALRVGADSAADTPSTSDIRAWSHGSITASIRASPDGRKDLTVLRGRETTGAMFGSVVQVQPFVLPADFVTLDMFVIPGATLGKTQEECIDIVHEVFQP